MVGEPLISNSIALVSCVLPAINLDHQPLGTAGEVKRCKDRSALVERICGRRENARADGTKA
jgi:hypothetical protein